MFFVLVTKGIFDILDIWLFIEKWSQQKLYLQYIKVVVPVATFVEIRVGLRYREFVFGCVCNVTQVRAIGESIWIHGLDVLESTITNLNKRVFGG